jgi:hypothetical protein
MAKFDEVWFSLQRLLHRKQRLNGWSREKDDTGLRFEIQDVDSTSITVLPGKGLPRRISKSDFEQVFAFWSPYCKGKIPRHEMARLSQNTSYIFAILRWQERLARS